MVCFIAFILFIYSTEKKILKILYTLSYLYIYPVVWNLFLHAIDRSHPYWRTVRRHAAGWGGTALTISTIDQTKRSMDTLLARICLS